MRTFRWMIASAVAVALAGCGADEISSAGAGGNITINNPPAQNPDPDPGSGDPDPVLVTPAAGCPTIAASSPLVDENTISGPTGEYRVCRLPAVINANTTLPRVPGLLYALDGRTNVGADLGPTGGTSLTLTIEAGVVIFAKTGTSWLAVNRGHKIQAVGTAERPIVFTSRDNILGLVDDDDQGQWGGVVLMGRAPITNCRAPGATPGTNACDRDTEGSADAALYGGELPADNSGTMRYVQIRYSGYVLGNNSELQSLTLEGVGSGTTIDHIQMHNSSDDGFENFGGRANMRYIVVTGADDDSVDLDVGYKGTIQYLIAVQKSSGQADSMIELDSADSNENDSPRTHMKIANFTFVHRNPGTANQAAMLFRGGADASLVNGVVTTPISCLRLNGENILSAAGGIPDKAGPPTFASVVMTCGAPAFRVSGNTLAATPWTDAAAAASAFSAGANTSSTFASTLTGGFINGANEAAAVATDPKTVDTQFDTTTYVGAVRDANDTWYAGWTCNSATANFGTGSTACTSLPSLAE